VPRAILAFAISYAAFLVAWMAFSILNFAVTVTATSALGAMPGTSSTFASVLVIALRFSILLLIGWLVLVRASWWGAAGIFVTGAQYLFVVRTHVQYAMNGEYFPSCVWLVSFAFLIVAAGSLLLRGAREWFRFKGRQTDGDPAIFE